MSSDTTTLARNETTRAKLLDLSLPQLIGGSMAAATAAALGSRLGVVGTIAGAAVGSVVSALAASVYITSMTRAGEVLRATRRTDRETATPAPGHVPDVVLPLNTAGTRRFLATSGVVFAIAAAFLFGLQFATGAPVTGTSLGDRDAAASPQDQSRGGVSAEGRGGSATPRSTSTGTPTGVPPTTPASGETPTGLPTTPQTGAPIGTVTTTPAEPDPTATTTGDPTPAPTTTGTAPPTQ